MAPRRQLSRSPVTRKYTGPLILVVDDQRDQRELYAEYFEAQRLRVKTAGDGETAFDLAVSWQPDVIVMDLSMPQIDGWEVTRRLKRDVRTRHLPVIACTAHAFGEFVQRAVDAGCDAYVVKPCLPENLLSEVFNVLEKTQRRAATAS